MYSLNKKQVEEIEKILNENNMSNLIDRLEDEEFIRECLEAKLKEDYNIGLDWIYSLYNTQTNSI